DKALRHGQRALPDVKREQEFTLRVHGAPDPLGRTLQARDGVGRTDLAILDRTEQGKQLIELDLSDPYVMQEVLREGSQLLRRLYEPLQHGVRGHLEHPRRPPDTQALGQTGDHPHDQLRGHALAVEDRTEGFQKVAATDDAEQLAPVPPTRMAVGAEIAPAHPTAIGTIRVGAEMA